MFKYYVLEPTVWHESPLEFEWDPESGELRGRDAEKVADLVAKAMAAGYVTSHPYPTTYEIQDPLHRPREMAAILGQFWKLPREWLRR